MLFRFIRWSFYTEGNDIKFGIGKVPTTDENKSIAANSKSENFEWEIPLRKVASHQNEEIGFIECIENYTCKIFNVINEPSSILIQTNF